MKNGRSIAALGLVLCAGGAVSAQSTKPHAGMMRFPDVSKTHIVFSYADDLWLVPREGGQATPLASPPGGETWPRFSPDGKTIAFQGNYDGDRDIYTIPVSGGVPFRVTHHPANEVPTGWHGDDEIVFHSNGLVGQGRLSQIFTVDAGGGMPAQLPPAYGANGAVSGDGEWLAFQPDQRDFRTWKRYVGGLASDIWIMNLDTLESKQITDWEGTDTLAMWHGSTVYYLSDAGPDHRLNIWSYDTDSGEREQVTKFSDYDVKFPSIGPGPKGRGEIVFQNGSSLFLLDLDTQRAKAVEVSIPGARPKIRERSVNVAGNITGGSISATGKRAVVEARGDLFTLPADRGPIRQITDSSGSAERTPAWSPDGRWIAYFSDADGEYELYLTQSDGKGETRQLTDGNKNYFFNIVWAPDSEKMIITDKGGTMMLVDAESGEITHVDKDPWGTQPAMDWSSDSSWIVYHKTNERSLTTAIWLYDVENDQTHQLTSGFFNDSSPAFDTKGDFIFFASNREFSAPQYEDIGSTFVYTNTGVLIAVPLRSDVESPWLIQPDEETWEEETEESGEEESSEEGGEEGGDSDEAGEGDGAASDPFADYDTQHPAYGKWEGQIKGMAALGMPDDAIDFTLIVLVDNEGDITGKSIAMGQEEPLENMTWDAGSNELVSVNDQGGITMTSRAKISGDSFSGTWNIEQLGIGGTWDGTRVTRELDPDVLGDVEPPAGGDGKKGGKKGGKEEDAEDERLEIEIEGFESRAMALPVGRGNFGNLDTNDKGHLLYVRAGTGQPPSIKILNIRDKEPSEKNVLSGAGGFDLSADGKKLLVAQGPTRFGIVNASAGQSLSNPLRVRDLTKTIDPRAEWEQIFTDAWRRHRDFFYVENMHGVDWDAVYKRYHAMLKDATSRSDVSFIIGEMISELNVGHAYYWGGDVEGEPSRNVGLLGVDFELASQTDDDGNEKHGYRIADIIEGGPWDTDAKGPLSALGVGVNEGDFLLAVNGVKVSTDKDPWAPFVGLAGDDVTLTVVSSLVGDEETRNEREVTIRPIGSEANLRYRAWVEANRKYVDEKSGGKIGYIYVPNTGVQGQNELFRQFYGQIGKEALLIDERWNGGGQIPTRFIELLNRPRTNYWARRDGKDWPWPYDSHQGPKAMLINGAAGSGGDMFPWLFKHNGLGKLIGTRTWGGLVGISGVPGLVDGGYTAVPTFGFYETDGTWGIEGHGVDPDIRVIDDPTKLAEGGQPQLDAAIDHLLREIERNGYEPADRPADPDRSGMGIAEDDK